jgi:hypothetical protein
MSSARERGGAAKTATSETAVSDPVESDLDSSSVGIVKDIIDRLLNKPRRFIAGLAIGALFAVGVLGYFAFELIPHGEWINGVVARLVPQAAASAAPDVSVDKFPGVMWLTTNDPSVDRKYQLKKFVLHGSNEFTGEYENVGNSHKGHVHGFERDGVIELVFAVDDAKSPGVDTVLLRPVQPTSQSEATFYVGFETAPDCDCNGYLVSNAPITSVAAIFSTTASPPDYVINAVFSGKPETKENFRTPAEVEESLNRRADVRR